MKHFFAVWVPVQALSLLLLTLGMRWAGHPRLLRLGELLHRRKLQALDTTWPLTRLRPALARGDRVTPTAILATLIAFKSLACFLFGIVVVFWLPLASVLVPAMVAVHDPDDPARARWVRNVAVLQVTSHAVAAALGFTLVLLGPLRDTSLPVVATEQAVLLAVGLAVSLVLAFSAARLEAAGLERFTGLHRHGGQRGD